MIVHLQSSILPSCACLLAFLYSRNPNRPSSKMGWFNVTEEEDYYSCDDNSVSDKDEKHVECPPNPPVQLPDQEEHDSEDSDIDADHSRAHGPKTTAEHRR